MSDEYKNERQWGHDVYKHNIKRSKDELAYMVTSDQCEDKYETTVKRAACRFGASNAERELKK